MSSPSHDRVAVVTGGAGGIGSATVTRLRTAGWRVAILDRDIALARKIAEATGGVAYEMDLADGDSIQAAADRVESEMGPVEAMACVAAHLENPHNPQDQDGEEWDAILRVNLTGTFKTLNAFGNPMRRRGRGSIVTVGSITSLNSSPLMAYGPTKAGIINMTRNFAVAWGREGVRLNVVHPGPTRTPAVEASYARGERSPDMMIRQTALGRLVTPEHVANAIHFLLSDEAAAITGIELPVDSGTLATGLWSLYGGVPDKNAG